MKVCVCLSVCPCLSHNALELRPGVNIRAGTVAQDFGLEERLVRHDESVCLSVCLSLSVTQCTGTETGSEYPCWNGRSGLWTGWTTGKTRWKCVSVCPCLSHNALELRPGVNIRAGTVAQDFGLDECLLRCDGRVCLYRECIGIRNRVRVRVRSKILIYWTKEQ